MSYASGLAHLDPVNGECRVLVDSNDHASLHAPSGLFGVIIPALVYVIFGTCKQLSVGPEAALSLL